MYIIMEYTYLLEEKANKNITLDNFEMENDMLIIYVLCYHINNNGKYPFLQFMMDKIPFCNNIIKEQLILPYLMINDNSSDIVLNVLNKVKYNLNKLNCDYTKVSENMYKGIIIDSPQKVYALVNISEIDIQGLYFERSTVSWFVLTSELINVKMVCNIPVDEECTNLFSKNVELGVLINPKTNSNYIIPDPVYTGGEIKRVEFDLIFGNRKKKIYDSCGEYFYFYRTFGDAVRYSGWMKDCEIVKIGDKVIVDKNGKYVSSGINRYALFVEGDIYIEKEKEFSLTDEVIENEYGECIILSNVSNEDMLVKQYSSSVSLSYSR